VTVARHVVVHGRVQGVFFRETTRRRASRVGVGGWVRNTDEGTVEAFFEGEPDDVDVLVQYVHTGPSGAHVERVEVHDAEPEGLRDFELR
jgi:acylphosphatase